MSEIMDIIDEKTYEGLKKRAKKDGLTIDSAIRSAVNEWLTKDEDRHPIFSLRRDRKKHVSIRDIKPYHTSKNNRTLSGDIDSIMYGV